MSVDDGVEASAFKHVFNTTVEVQASFVPHLHVEDVQTLERVAPHSAADPHRQVPALQVSDVPVHVTPEHGSESKFNSV